MRGLFVQPSSVEYSKFSINVFQRCIVDREKQGNEYALRPVQESCWQIVMLHQAQPVEGALIRVALFRHSQLEVMKHAGLFDVLFLGLPKNAGHESPLCIRQAAKPDPKRVLVLRADTIVRNFRRPKLSKLVRVEFVDGVGNASDCIR